MTRRKKRERGKVLLFPHPFFVLLLDVLCTAALFRKGRQYWRRWRRWPLFQRYREDLSFRMHCRLITSLLINLLYALLRLSVGVRFRSLWDIHLGTYYLLLCVIRWILQCGVSLTSSLADVRRTYRRCHICGWLLLVLDLILSGMVFLMVFRDHTYDYPGMLIYLAALYTFYITISAGVHLIRDRRHQDPIVNAANILSLTAALVSMPALQTAMLTQFGDGSLSPSQMNAISGAAVCFGVLGLALFLIRSSHAHLQQTTQNRS